MPTEAVSNARSVPVSLKSAWYAVTILSIAYVLSYADRIIINLLARPIKADLGLGDTQFGLLTGVAFGIFYTAMALPLGRMADILSRRWIVCIGVAVFSLFSVYSGVAASFVALFIARIGVGAGEASLTPAAHSIISDYFPPEKLGRAMSVFVMSAFIGIGAAYVGGGATIAWLNTLGTTHIPLLGDLKPWQMAFVLVALPGFIVAPLLLTVKEPPRRSSHGVVPLRQVLNEVSRRRSTLVPMLAGFAMITLSGYASTVWNAPFFDRTYGWGPLEFGLFYGLIYLAFGPTGAFFAGWMCDRLTARGVKDAPLQVSAYAALLGGITGGLAPLMPTPELALLLMVPTIFTHTMAYPLAATAMQLIAPPGMRAQLSSVYMLVINLVGLGLGPVVIGLMTDFLFTSPGDLRYSLAIVNGLCGPLALGLLLLASRPYIALRKADLV
jgi:MFS family permease